MQEQNDMRNKPTLYWFLGELCSKDPRYHHNTLKNMLAQLQISQQALPYNKIELIDCNTRDKQLNIFANQRRLITLANQVKSNDTVISSCTGTTEALYFLEHIPHAQKATIRYLAFHNDDPTFLEKSVLGRLKQTFFICPKSLSKNFMPSPYRNVYHLNFDDTYHTSQGKTINSRIPYALESSHITPCRVNVTYQSLGESVYLAQPMTITDRDDREHYIGTILYDKYKKIVINITLIKTLLDALKSDLDNQASLSRIIQSSDNTAMALTLRNSPQQQQSASPPPAIPHHPPAASFNMQVLSGFMIALGIAAIAIAFAVLSLATMNTAGVLLASSGLISISFGRYGLFKHARRTPPSDAIDLLPQRSPT